MQLTNYKLQLVKFVKVIRIYLFLCLFCGIFLCSALPTFAQNLESISEKINYGDAEQRRDALFQIRNLKTSEASRLAIPLLSDSSEIIRATSTNSIIYISSDEAANLLLPLLTDKSELVRRETATALGKIQNLSAINPLILIAQKDKILEVRNSAIIALGNIGDVSAINFLNQILQKKLKDEEDFVRRSAARSVGQIAKNIFTNQTKVVTPSSFLPEKFKISDNSEKLNLVSKFPNFKNSINLLIQILQNPKESNDSKREAAFALGEIRDISAISILEMNLNNKDYYLAEICKESLSKINLNLN